MTQSDLAKARDKWLNGDIGQKCCEGTPRGQYLQNRLEAAFIAGWISHELLEQAKPLPDRKVE